MFYYIASLTKEELRIIDSQSTLILADWWCQLNHWRWPDKLPFPEPTRHIPGGRRSRAMDYIESKIGKKEILHYHNVISQKAMTEEEFALWWNREIMPQRANAK